MTGGTHWTRGKEQVHSSVPIRFLIFLSRYFPLEVIGLGVLLTGVFYYIFSARGRRECKAYQLRVAEYTKETVIKKPHILRQITSFALCVAEKVEGWLGRIHYDDITFADDDVAQLKAQLAAGRGALLVGSHLGNMEMLRSLATFDHIGVERKVSVTIIMDTATTATFNRTMGEMNDGIAMDIIDASRIEPDTIVVLQERIAAGGMVVLAGDRTPVGGRHKLLAQTFMGRTAQFPHGTFLIAALLKADTYFFFALRKKDFMWRPKYNMFVHKTAVTFANCSRYEREERIGALCGEFVRTLEGYCLQYPYQWYNFYDFWAEGETIRR